MQIQEDANPSAPGTAPATAVISECETAASPGGQTSWDIMGHSSDV